MNVVKGCRGAGRRSGAPDADKREKLTFLALGSGGSGYWFDL